MRATIRTAQTSLPCLTAVLLSAHAPVVGAQPALDPAELARCAELVDHVTRLACFDALASELSERADAERTAPQPTEAISANSVPQAENENAFGAELIGGRGALGPDEIQSLLIGEFAGWRGNTTFRLENGQVWRQAEEGRLVFRSAAPLVTIRRGALGTYRLTVEGINRSVRVRRLE